MNKKLLFTVVLFIISLLTFAVTYSFATDGNGAMNASKKYRGKIASVIMSYVKNMENDLKNARPERVFITHSGCDRETVETVWFPAIAVWVRLAFCILRYDFSNTL